MTRLATLLLLLQAAPDDFQKRGRTDGSKIFVDDKLLFEGPWKTAEIRLVDFGGRRAKALFGAFPVWKQVVVVADGEERLRLPVRSEAKPIDWPPVRPEEVKPLLKKLTETEGEKKTFVVSLSTDKGDVEIYRGPAYETRVERTTGGFVVWLNDEVLYRVTKWTKPNLRVEDVFMAVNLHRAKAGLEVTRLTPALSRACDLHALYLAKNEPKGLSGHEEDPKGLGYTEEGARAGKRSVIAPFNPHESVLDATESLMATLYHRVSMLQPGLSEIGAGWAYRKDGLGYLVIDVGSTDLKVDPKVYPIVYPPNGQTDVPVEFGLGSRETPNPLPDGVQTAGYPVTIQFPERSRRLEVEARLLQGTLELACHVSTPDKPARADTPQPGVVCLIPKEKLRPSTSYTVRVKERTTGLEREWTFTTGK
jgi:hypothetical protein